LGDNKEACSIAGLASVEKERPLKSTGERSSSKGGRYVKNGEREKITKGKIKNFSFTVQGRQKRETAGLKRKEVSGKKSLIKRIPIVDIGEAGSDRRTLPERVSGKRKEGVLIKELWEKNLKVFCERKTIPLDS